MSRVPEFPEAFASLPEEEQHRLVREWYPWMDEDEMRFVAAIERGELRPDLGCDLVQSDLDLIESEDE